VFAFAEASRSSASRAHLRRCDFCRNRGRLGNPHAAAHGPARRPRQSAQAEAHETALYVLSGKVGMYYEEKLENHMVTGAGDFVYIPANTRRLPYNMSQTEPATAVISRTDPNEQESVVLLPELDAIPW
jgi:uncharacterized RmlC-like cupin family protein